MDPVTLHFNVFKAGEPARTTLQVEDPRSTTILDLKQQLFGDEIKASKSVRFIGCGKILDDASSLVNLKLGKEAHIHVSISEGSPTRRLSSAPSGEDSGTESNIEAKSSESVGSSEETATSTVDWIILLGAVFFIGTGAFLCMALRKRRQHTMHTSQLLFICGAVWVYALLFHGIPALIQALSKRSSAVKETTARGVAPASIPIAAGVGDEVTSAAASARESAGLSFMTPATLPPAGDAAAASVLTQRR